MAGSHKKRLLENKQSNQGSDADVEEMQADFEGRNPEPQDFEGIKQLLKQLFLREHVDLTRLTDLLLRQQGLGSVLKQSWNDEEDEDDDLGDESEVFGITSVVNLPLFKDDAVVQQLYTFLRKTSNDHNKDQQDAVNEILNQRIGFLVNERFINIPAKIADPLLSTLDHEIQKMKKRDPTYNFDFYILICKKYKPKGNNTQSIFSNAEEEIFSKEADVSVEYSVADQCDTGVGGEWTEEDTEIVPYREILFIKESKFAKIIDDVKKFVS